MFVYISVKSVYFTLHGTHIILLSSNIQLNDIKLNHMLQ